MTNFLRNKFTLFLLLTSGFALASGFATKGKWMLTRESLATTAPWTNSKDVKNKKNNGSMENLPAAPAPMKRAASLNTTIGVIGVSEENPVDNPSDNLFHVNLSSAIKEGERAYLVYELDGVEDHTAISRSINDGLSIGGYLIRKRKGWQKQREQIELRLLEKGDNVIRFTVPQGASYSYRVRNLSIEVEPVSTGIDISAASKESIATQRALIINQPSASYYSSGTRAISKGYIKGFVTGLDTKGVQIVVEGKKARVHKGEFEAMVEKKGNQNSFTVQVEALFPNGEKLFREVTFTTALQAHYSFPLTTQSLIRGVHYAQQTFNESKALSLSLKGAHLLSDAGALKRSATLSITALSDRDIPALDAGMVNVTKYQHGYRFLPHHTTFAKQVSLHMAYDESKIPDGYTEKDIRTYFFDEGSHHWIALPTDTLLLETRELLSTTTHFTDMINAIIQVPESPEVNAYNSTSMKGIKAANPTAGINLINPPSANNTGSASLGYGLEIPAGRKGMQPSLGISYNSSGGNSWLGLGWNLSLPAVTIDTRWGVPRYDPVNESETYNLNGEQLSPVAHRGELGPRTVNKRFYPRVEGAFSKIIRHGEQPEKYFWEVTDKNGTKYFYGGTPDKGVDEKATLSDAHGNKAYWALVETRDTDGNFVRYHYSKVEDSGLANGSVMGYNLYISKITYTGNGASQGRYSIHFTRDRELKQTLRKDVTINANLGFKQVTADLLKRVEVKFDDITIRSYGFDYKTGVFFKTLLATITQYDADNKEFNKHQFDYFDELNTAAGFKPFGTLQQWNSGSDEVKTLLGGKASALSGTKSNDLGVGMSISIGFGIPNFTKKNSVGGNFNYSRSTSEGMLCLIDLNGDGLPDKVFMDEKGNCRYRPNKLDKTGVYSFGEAVELLAISHFYKEKSKTISAGLEASASGGIVSAFVGASTSKTTSTTSVYLSDVNGDGLPDIVKDGQVFYNQINTVSGHPQFSPSTVDASSQVAGGLLIIDEKELEEAKDQSPLHDVVRIWQAPYSGTISIKAPVKLLEAAGEEKEEGRDGVRVAIQLKGIELWHTTIPADDYSEKLPLNVSRIEVVKGERIFFRVQSLFNGYNDQVSWAPVISYLKEDLSLVDANNKSLYQFSANQDFIISTPQVISLPIGGNILIEGPVGKALTSDDVHAQILRIKNGDTTAIWEKTFGWQEQTSFAINEPVKVDSADAFTFQIKTATGINPAAVKWQPRLYYTSTTDPVKYPATDELGEPTIEFYPVASYDLYTKPVRTGSTYQMREEKDTLKILPLLSFTNTFAKGRLIFSVKSVNKLLYKDTLTVNAGKLLSADTVKITANKGEQFYIEYHFDDTKLAGNILQSRASVTIGKQTQIILAASYTQLEELIFGPMYRNWGHFAYNGNKLRATMPIREEDLKISQQVEDAKELEGKEFKTAEELKTNDKIYKASQEVFIILVPMAKKKASLGAEKVPVRVVWNGYDEYTYLDATTISSSRNGEDAPQTAESLANSIGGGKRAVNKISISRGNSFSIGGGISSAKDAGFGASGSYGRNDGHTQVMVDFMDMNGDRYPDVVTPGRVQYSTPWGALNPLLESTGTAGVNHQTTTSSDGVTLSGSYSQAAVTPLAFNIKKMKVSVGNGKNSAGLSGDYSKGNNQADFSLMDMNGDGLPDRLYRNGMVSLNIGYSFEKEEMWSFSEISQGESKSFGAGASVSLVNGSISAGVGISTSENQVNHSLQDMNGDGLLDMVHYEKGKALTVRINTGSGFGEETAWVEAAHINRSSTTSKSANLAFTVDFLIMPGIRMVLNPSTHAGHSMTRDLEQFSDVDGDGYPDMVRSSEDNQLSVYRSAIGRTNLLKTVNRPMGATIVMDYKREGNTADMPQAQWALSKVEIEDGYNQDGVNRLLTTFAYENGYHDRHEREFYGFEKVTTFSHETDKKNKPYSSSTQNFSIENYYKKGLLMSESMSDAKGNTYIEKKNRYEMKQTASAESIFPALTESRESYYEGSSEAKKRTRAVYSYNELGNLVSYTDYGDEGAGDDLVATITYHELTGPYIMALPKSITVANGGNTLRKREASIDSKGHLTEIKQYLQDGTASVHSMSYDSYGNLSSLSRPANAKGERLKISYEYDKEVATYVTKSSNSYGYSSEASYDYLFGQLLQSKDLNGQQINYTLDKRGRVTRVQGPYEQKGGQAYTLAFSYHPEAKVPYAVTKHYDPSSPKNDLLTVTFTDGLGRVLQVKKDAAIFAGENMPDKEVMVVSGSILYDGLGRAIKAHYPTLDEKRDTANISKTVDGMKPTQTTYDVLGRVIGMSLPDGAETETSYGFDTDRNGVVQFVTTTTDANGKKSAQYSDVKGRVSAVKNLLGENPVWTSFVYNALGEQIAATDDMGGSTLSQYDMLGRRTSRKHPDAGTSVYSYDPAGNLTGLQTANLQKEGGVISYSYDYERLTEISYPQNPENNVRYSYGKMGDTYNRAGRIVLQEDATGAQEFFYGPLGEVVKNIRTVVIPGHDEQSYSTEWEYDTWNRLLSMTYPDEEKVEYTYNAGGLLHSMKGEKAHRPYIYVKQLGYDKFEQRVFLSYGNGTKTTYSYEQERRRLSGMEAKTAKGRLMMDNEYTYDKVNNILSLKNTAPVPAANLMGGTSEYSYSYDDLYRLTKAEGSFSGSNEAHRYSLSMSYNSVGGVTEKMQLHEKKGGTNEDSWKKQKKTSYSQSYSYGKEQPHAAIHIGEQSYSYDANGNSTGFTHDESGQKRNIVWDEENRIRTIMDNGAAYHYIYDASGERVLKGHSSGQSIFINATQKGGSGGMGNYTVYVNPYLVLKSGGYTKHYYIEGQRIVSKLGSGMDLYNKGRKAGTDKVDYAGKAGKLQEGIAKNLKFLVIERVILNPGKTEKSLRTDYCQCSWHHTSEIFRYFYYLDKLNL